MTGEPCLSHNFQSNKTSSSAWSFKFSYPDRAEDSDLTDFIRSVCLYPFWQECFDITLKLQTSDFYFWVFLELSSVIDQSLEVGE